MDARFIFTPTYYTWNYLCAQYQKQALEAPARACLACKAVIKIANATKIALVGVAFVVATIATGVFSIIALPYRAYNLHRNIHKIYQSDISMLTKEEQTAIRKEISDYIEKHACNFPDKEKSIEKLMASYARSHKIYGPIARAWVEYLLEKANREGKKLVFLARDATAPFKMAKKLMEKPEYQKKYPNLIGDNQLVLAYFSRKLVANCSKTRVGRQLFKNYAEKQLGIKPGSSSLFIDVGFTGTMIDSVKKMLSWAKIEYEYLISMTNKANGFLATNQHPLDSVPSAGKNLGIHWLEDTHQGNIKSPSILVKERDQVYPNTKTENEKTYCNEKYSFDFVLRKFTLKAVVDAFSQHPLSGKDLLDRRARFDETLTLIKRSAIPLFLKHI